MAGNQYHRVAYLVDRASGVEVEKSLGIDPSVGAVPEKLADSVESVGSGEHSAVVAVADCYGFEYFVNAYHNLRSPFYLIRNA